MQTAKRNLPSSLGNGFGDQDFCWDAQAAMEPADHGQCQRALAIEHFVDAVAPTNDRLKIFDGQTALIHAEFDSFHWIGSSDGGVLGLIGLDQRGQNVQAISFP